MRYSVDPSKPVYKQMPEDRWLRPMSAAIGSLVYRFYDASGSLLYVGVTSRPRSRWYAHSKRAEWWSLAASVEVTGERMKEYDARQLETEAIHSERPLFNIAKVVSAHV